MQKFLTPQEKEELNSLITGNRQPWRDRLPRIYPDYFSRGFSSFHADAWDFADTVELGKQQSAFVACWARGAGKSTAAEVMTVELGAHNRRRYAWYMRSTQDQADKSVENVQMVLESQRIAQEYPHMYAAAVSRIGRPKAWRRNRLHTASGYVVDGMGIDKASRGVKVAESRPDLIIFDDIDERHDTPKTTAKKIQTLTQSIIPAGSSDVLIIFIQNKIIPNGVMAQLLDGRADFLLDRIVSGPHPAVIDLTYEPNEDNTFSVTGGEPTWPEGQGLDVVERQINLWGPSAFKREAQHEVDRPEGALWQQAWIDDHRKTVIPEMTRVGVGVDPHATTGETGIVAAGIATINGMTHAYVFDDATIGGSPATWGGAVVAAYNKADADIIVGEINNGGDMIEHTIRSVEGGQNVNYKKVRATRGKIMRAEPIAALYEAGRVHHVGYFVELEEQQCSYVPGDDSPNNLDALVWALTELMIGEDNTIRRGKDPTQGYRG